MRSKIIWVIAVILVVIAATFLFRDRIAISALSVFYDLDVSYKSLAKDPYEGYVFENLKLKNKRLGFGFFSARASFKPVSKRLVLKSVDFDFKFKDAHFIKSKINNLSPLYDSIEGLVAVPFEGRWTYKEISGTVEIFSNGLTLKETAAIGKDIKVFISGDIFYNNVIDAGLTVHFSKSILKDIPPELHSVIMEDEPLDWKSFTVKIKGDMNSPSVQISGKLFRLNVGSLLTND